MRTTDLFSNNRSAKRLNESLAKTFGQKLNLESFSIEQLEDARNKLRTQIYTARSSSNFNETVENDTLSKAQFMHDAIVAELSERDEPIVDNTVQEGGMDELAAELSRIADEEDYDTLYDLLSDNGPTGKYLQDQIDDITGETGLHPKDDFERIEEILMGRIQDEFGGQSDNEGGDTDDGYALASAGHGSDEDYGTFNQGEGYDMDQVRADAAAGIKKSIDKQSDDRMAKMRSDKNKGFMAKVGDKIIGGAKGAAKGFMGKESTEQDIDPKIEKLARATVKAIKQAVDAGYATGIQGGDYHTIIQVLEDYAGDLGEQVLQFVNELNDDESAAWENRVWELDYERTQNESVKKSGDNMSNLREGEIQQASAIVTAKTMVDRVGRWIEELSGMENDTLLQLGDSIRDEMGQEQAKAFIQAVAPAIQQALDTLKTTRDTLSTGVRSLASGEQPTDMLGGEPGADMAAPAEPDAMNPAADDMTAEPAGDDFDAAEPAAGGLGDAGREQRESIDRQSRLMKVLAG